MNILYVSHLTDRISEGPNYSVPAQIKAQASYDSVFWWNLTEAVQDFWLESGLFHGIKEYPEKKISRLPAPFDHPDLVVFESLYYIDDVILSFECRKRKIPYVVVPRSALTWQGQAKKRLKKIPANIVLFKPMTKHAKAIHYLTKKEFVDSGQSWGQQCFIIPNGITNNGSDHKQKKYNSSSSLKGVYIGRFDPYQKGLDLLLEACCKCKENLIESKVSIELYGPERMGYREEYERTISQNGLNSIMSVHEGVFGDEKENVLKKADFFVLTSRFEGMPMALIEAMSYGLPCLVSEGTNMTADVEEYNAGWTCDVSAESIAAAMESMISDKYLFVEKSENAWHLSQKYNWDMIAELTHDEFCKLLNI